MIDSEKTAARIYREHYAAGVRPEVRVLPGGRVNLSFLVVDGDRRYVLQRLHPVFGGDGVVVQNTSAAAEALKSAGLAAPTVRPALDGRLYVQAGGIWRLTTWLPGSPAGGLDERTASECGRFLGLFHRALADFQPEIKPLPQAEYNREGGAGPELWRLLLDRHRRRKRFGRAEVFLRQGMELSGDFRDLGLGRRILVHGDPKLDNFLFDPCGRVSALIDLDTVRPGSLVWELGDALRSWAVHRRGLDEVRFDPGLARVALGAYRENGLELQASELSAIGRALTAAALNLARRYLEDFFEEAYFAPDPRYADLAEQNLSRGRAMLDLAGQVAAGFET